jgi:hypothetical protein
MKIKTCSSLITPDMEHDVNKYIFALVCFFSLRSKFTKSKKYRYAALRRKCDKILNSYSAAKVTSNNCEHIEEK